MDTTHRGYLQPILDGSTGIRSTSDARPGDLVRVLDDAGNRTYRVLGDVVQVRGSLTLYRDGGTPAT